MCAFAENSWVLHSCRGRVSYVMAEDAKISKLTVADLDAVDGLMMRNSGTLGFLPLEALKAYLNKGDVIGVKSTDSQLIGYLLYGTYQSYFRITQLCVSEKFRGQGIARRLLDTLKESATTQKTIKLNCRNDFPAHHMWRKLGFVPLDERPGRSKEGHPLTLWRLTLAPDDQLSLFRANISDNVLDVVIDANIFFDFDEPDNNEEPSKALLSDFFVDSLNLWHTDELFTEISRDDDAHKREEARNRARNFLTLQHDPLLFESFKQALKTILPSNNENEEPDINHLAKTAAADVNVFVTRDQTLLKKAKQINNLVNVELLSPTSLIIRLRELSGERDREPDRVAGLELRWRSLDSSEFEAFPFDRFLEEGEKLNQLRQKVSSLLVNPVQTELEVLWSEDRPVALRILTHDFQQRTLTIGMGRLAKSESGSLFRRFLISDAVYVAIRKNLTMLKFKESTLSVNLMQGLSEMGFTRYGDEFIRFCFTRCLDRESVLSEITELAPEAVNNYRDVSPHKLERSCSPLSSFADQGYFLIPIRPGYALNLFDRQQSSHDLFGGNPDVLLRWSNIYYRKKTHHKMLQAPGRILWYVSGDRQQIVCVSHLDEVVIGTPKELFRRFEKSGTLEWRDLYKMCEGDISEYLMALKFSHTFPLKRSIPLAEIWKTFDEDGLGRTLQSPRKLPWATYQKLFQLGYPERS